MKKILYIVSLLVLTVGLAYSQLPQVMRANLQILTSTGTDPVYTITGIFNDPVGKYDGNDVQLGDFIYVLDGVESYNFVVTSIISQSSSVVELVVTDITGNSNGLPTGQALITRGSSNLSLPNISSNLRDDLRSVVINEAFNKIDSLMLTNNDVLIKLPSDITLTVGSGGDFDNPSSWLLDAFNEALKYDPNSLAKITIQILENTYISESMTIFDKNLSHIRVTSNNLPFTANFRPFIFFRCQMPLFENIVCTRTGTANGSIFLLIYQSTNLNISGVVTTNFDTHYWFEQSSAIRVVTTQATNTITTLPLSRGFRMLSTQARFSNCLFRGPSGTTVGIGLQAHSGSYIFLQECSIYNCDRPIDAHASSLGIRITTSSNYFRDSTGLDNQSSIYFVEDVITSPSSSLIYIRRASAGPSGFRIRYPFKANYVNKNGIIFDYREPQPFEFDSLKMFTVPQVVTNNLGDTTDLIQFRDNSNSLLAGVRPDGRMFGSPAILPNDYVNLNQAVSKLTDNITYTVCSDTCDFTTISAALEAASSFSKGFTNGTSKSITIRLCRDSNGNKFNTSEQVILDGGDYSNVRLTSGLDTVMYVPTTSPSVIRFLNFINCNAPTLDSLHIIRDTTVTTHSWGIVGNSSKMSITNCIVSGFRFNYFMSTCSGFIISSISNYTYFTLPAITSDASGFRIEENSSIRIVRCESYNSRRGFEIFNTSAGLNSCKATNIFAAAIEARNSCLFIYGAINNMYYRGSSYDPSIINNLIHFPSYITVMNSFVGNWNIPFNVVTNLGSVIRSDLVSPFTFADQSTMVTRPQIINGINTSDTLSALTVRNSTPTTLLDVKNDGKIGINTTTPSASSILDITSTTRGFLPPRMTTTQRNAIVTPAAGLMLYDNILNEHYGYDGTNWYSLKGGGNVVSANYIPVSNGTSYVNSQAYDTGVGVLLGYTNNTNRILGTRREVGSNPGGNREFNHFETRVINTDLNITNRIFNSMNVLDLTPDRTSLHAATSTVATVNQYNDVLINRPSLFTTSNVINQYNRIDFRELLSSETTNPNIGDLVGTYTTFRHTEDLGTNIAGAFGSIIDMSNSPNTTNQKVGATNVGLLVTRTTNTGNTEYVSKNNEIPANTDWAIYNNSGWNSFTGTTEVSGLRGEVVELSTSTTISPTAIRHTYLINAGAGNVTITLPSIANSFFNNRGVIIHFVIIDTNAGANTVTIDGNGSETINGAATATTTTAYDSFTLQAHSSGWYIIK